MTRDQVLAVLPKMVTAFTSPETQAKLDATGGDLGQVLGVVMEIQGGVLVAEGIDPMQGLTALGKLKQDYADDSEVQGLLGQLEAKVAEAKRSGA